MGKGRNETPTYSRNVGMRYRASFNSDNQVEYEGWALNPNAVEGDLSWQIMKHTYTSNNLTASNWANGSDDFAFSWTLKTSYTY